MPKLHVVTRKEELDETRIADKVIVVLDVLFATTTIAAAFDAGATAVLPTGNPEAARAAARDMDGAPHHLAGEHLAERIEGFGHFAPMALASEGLTGKRLIQSTTNGTVALDKASRAHDVYAGALVNGRAVAEYIAANAGEATVILMCSGSMGRLNLEDLYGAGHIAAALLEHREDWLLTDAARLSLTLRAGKDPVDCLMNCRVGWRMQAEGLEDEVRYSAQCDVFSVVPRLEGGHLVDVAPGG